MKPSRLLVILIACALALAVPPVAGAASYGYFSVTFSGKQSVLWSISGGKTDVCGAYSGTGRTDFKFGSTTRRKVYVSKSTMWSFFTKASGTQSGTYHVDTSGCLPPPGPSYSGPTSGCGPIAFKPELNFNIQRSGTWIHSLTATRDIDDRNFDCAHYLQLTSYDDGVLNSCGPIENVNRNFENNAIREMGSEGIFPTKFSFTPRALLKIKKGRKKTFTAKKSFKCLPTSTTGLPVQLSGSTKYTLTFKRTG